jgi:hypothetical protein
MAQSKAFESVQLLQEKSRHLQTRSSALLNESRELCLASHHLRNVHAFGRHRRSTRYDPTTALRLLAEEPSSPNIEEATSVIQCELIRIRTPGFDRNSTWKIIKP